MKKGIRKAWDIVTSVLVGIVVVAAVALVGARLVGLRVYNVLSGSMEPEYPIGSLIYVKKIDPEDIEPGTVITFMSDATTVVTHRVTQVIPDETDSSVLYFETKGDANASEDAKPVHCNNVIGTPVLTIPYMGYVANYIQSPPGLYIAVAATAVLLLLVFLPDLLSTGDKKKNKE